MSLYMDAVLHCAYEIVYVHVIEFYSMIFGPSLGVG